MLVGEHLRERLDKIDALRLARGRGWLSSTPPDFQDRVAARVDLIRIAPGQSLYNVGDDSGGLFGLVRGRLDFHLTTLGNLETLAFVGQPGIWVGDIAAVIGHQRIMTVVAYSPCDILRLPRAEMLRILQETPSAWQHIAEMLAQNFARAIEAIDYLRCPDPSRRVAAMLLSLNGNRPPEPILLSQIEIAELTRLGRTTVQAALFDLAEKGLVRRGYASIEIIEIAALRQFAETPDDD
jgi:CRP/FNR family transcriptional regulator, cyclic AMP receptor protein